MRQRGAASLYSAQVSVRSTLGLEYNACRAEDAGEGSQGFERSMPSTMLVVCRGRDFAGLKLQRYE